MNLAPDTRRKIAMYILVASVALMVVNVGAYLLGWIDQSALILITLILSWLAITFTAADMVFTTDVRVQQEDEES